MTNENIEELNHTYQTIRNELHTKYSNSIEDLGKAVDVFLVPSIHEKNFNAEIPTPPKLRTDMLSTIEDSFWTSQKNVFEPCAGKGGFVIDMVMKFMDGLTESIPNALERYKTIVEKCIYISDINPLNTQICEDLLRLGYDIIGREYDIPTNPNTLKLNIHTGDTLELDIKQKWGLCGFHLVISNPPFQQAGAKNTGNTIWQTFTRQALEMWIQDEGLFVFIHPPGWRKPTTSKSKTYGLYDLMCKKNHMKYLSMHDVRDGKRNFGCGTRYDWYCIQRVPPTYNLDRRREAPDAPRRERCSLPQSEACLHQYATTEVNDIFGKRWNLNLLEWKWLPHHHFEQIRKLVSFDDSELKLHVLYNRTNYGSDKNYVSKTEDEVFKYPLIYTTPKTGTRWMYSSRNDRGHFGVKKVIFGSGGISKVVEDMSGKYGMTESSLAIELDDDIDVFQLVSVLESEEFKTILKSCTWSNYQFDWRLFTYFRKDFYKLMF